MIGNPFDYGGDIEKREAVRRLEELGACLGAIDSELVHAEFTPAWDQTPIGDAALPEIVSCVNTMGNVDTLDLSHTTITDDGVRYLTQLDRLPTLLLAGTRITDRAVRNLPSIRGLTALALSGTCVSDAALSTLLEMTALEFLQLYKTQITADGYERLKRAFPHAIIEHDARLGGCGLQQPG